MTEVGIRALKNSLSAWVRRAEAGERVLVTDRGRVVAALVPAASERTSSASRINELIAAGVVRPATDPRPLLEGMRTLNLPKGTAAQLIDEDRDER